MDAQREDGVRRPLGPVDVDPQRSPGAIPPGTARPTVDGPGAGRRRRSVRRWLTDVRDDEAAVVLRQVPFVALFASAGLVLLVLGRAPTSAAAVAVAVVATLAVVGLAVAAPWDRLPVGTRLVLAALQFVAAGALRSGTGGSDSVVTPLLFVPVVVAASEPGRRGIPLAVAAPALIVLMPFLTGVEEATPRGVVRALVLTLVALATSLSVNALTERIRARDRAARELRATSARLRAESERDALEVAARTDDARRARDLFGSVIDAVTEHAIIGTDVRGVVDLFNPGAERLLGVGADRMTGRSIVDLHDPDELAARAREAGSQVPVGVAGPADPRTDLRTDHGAGPAADPAAHPAADPAADPAAEPAVGPSVDPAVAVLTAAAQGGGSPVRDWTYVRGGGGAVVVRVAVTRRVDRAGVTNGYIFVATDMTAEREAARLKDEFVSLISHELRTPLSSILGYLELMVESGELSVEQRGYVAVVERNANRLLRLVGDLLFTAQVEAGRFAVVRRPVDVAASVRAAVESAGPGAVAAGVELVVVGCEVPVVVGGDAVRLGQAWDNLISNAVKFTGAAGAGGRVVVELSVGAGSVQVVVSDTGVGIAAGDLDRLFGRFVRAQSATRHAVPGVGLGLAITRAILTAHDGDLTVRSTLGQGTTMTATLPHDAG